MGLSIHIWIPSTLSGWKYCLKNPKSFFKSRNDTALERELIDGLKLAIDYAYRCSDNAKVTLGPLMDENNRLRDKLHRIERAQLELSRQTPRPLKEKAPGD